MSRNPEDLTPEMQMLYNQFKERMETAKIDFILTATFRSQEEQDKLYAQGRTEPGRIVTWVRHSKHTDRIAFDIAIMKNGKITWDGNEYAAAGKIGMDIGLTWGGSWATKTDKPHFELRS